MHTSEWCLAVIRDVAAALQAAHRLGIAHRRISPTVIYVDPDQVDPHGVVARVGGWDRADLGGTGVRTRRSFISGEGQQFVAPEVVDGTVQNQVVADLYSLARVIEWIWEELGPTPGVEPRPTGLAQLVETLGHPDPDERSASARDVFESVSAVLSRVSPTDEHVLDDADLMPGHELSRGRFLIVRVLGGGGTSRVFEVEDRFAGFGRHWALKVYKVEFSRDLDFIRREFAAHEDIDHPNVVKVKWILEIGGRACLVMELLPFPTLLDHVENHGPLELQTALEWFDGLLDALVSLHGSDGGPIVHRDIKPENLLVDQEEQGLVLIDFGLADAPHGGGTIGYMRAAADPSSSDPDRDLFALAVTLHQALTEFHPFSGQGCTGPPILDPALPDPLLEFLRRALAEDSEQGFRTAEEMRRALTEVRRDLGHLPPGPESKSDPVPPDDLPEGDVLSLGNGVVVGFLPGSARTRVPQTPAGEVDVQISVARAQVHAEPAIRLDLELCRAENGEAWIRATDAHRSPRRLQRLLHGLRPGIRPVPGHQGSEYMELRQAQIVGDPNWPSLRRVSKEVLDEGAGVDCEGELVALGAIRVDTQETVWGATNNRRRDLCVVFPAGNERVPIVAYVLTRVAPLVD